MKRLFDPIRAAERSIREAALETTAPVVDDGRNAHPKIQTDGNTERVEPWAEIRDRRWNSDFVTCSYALHSPSMTSGLNA